MVVAYCNFCPKKPQKGDFCPKKSGGLLEFRSSGGLIKSGLLFSQTWYVKCKYILRPQSEVKKYDPRRHFVQITFEFLTNK